jgi:hypothetical protein
MTDTPNTGMKAGRVAKEEQIRKDKSEKRAMKNDIGH